MSKTVEFLFDFGSPTTYLAATQLPAIAQRTKASIVWTPILLGGVFKATNNMSPAMVPAKGKHMTTDLARFAQRYNVPLATNPYFPVNTLPMMRGAISYQQDGDFHGYVKAMFEAMWVTPKNLNDPEEINATLQKAGFDCEDFAQRTASPHVKKALIDNTQKAVERGAFGAPTFFVKDEMFFGQDRLDFLEDALSA